MLSPTFMKPSLNPLLKSKSLKTKQTEKQRNLQYCLSSCWVCSQSGGILLPGVSSLWLQWKFSPGVDILAWTGVITSQGGEVSKVRRVGLPYGRAESRQHSDNLTRSDLWCWLVDAPGCEIDRKATKFVYEFSKQVLDQMNKSLIWIIRTVSDSPSTNFQIWTSLQTQTSWMKGRPGLLKKTSLHSTKLYCLSFSQPSPKRLVDFSPG